MFLKPLPPSTTTPKSSKGTGAREITRNKILAVMEEKERKKQAKSSVSEKGRRKRSNRKNCKRMTEESRREKMQRRREIRVQKPRKQRRAVEHNTGKREQLIHVTGPLDPEQHVMPDPSSDDLRPKRSCMGGMTDVIDPNMCSYLEVRTRELRLLSVLSTFMSE